MKFEDYQNAIIICKDAAKENLLKDINALHKLLNIKVITLSEFKNKYLFSYTKEAIFYVSKKYNCIPEIAKIYIDNLYFLKPIESEKVDFLKTIKDDLIENGLITSNNLFKEYLKGKTIVLYELDYVDKFYKNLFEELKAHSKVIEYKFSKEQSKKPIYSAEDKEEEIVFVASQIAKLIRDGIDINRIKLANVSPSYHFAIRKTFKNFNIPVEIPSSSKPKSSIIVEKFKNSFSRDIANTFEELKSYIKDDRDNDLYKKLIEIVNSYSWARDLEEVRDMIFDDLDSIQPKTLKLKNAVRTIDFCGDVIEEDDYIFLINFNEGVIPVNAKDEDYLNDDERSRLGVSTSVDLNVMRKREVQEKIASTKNLVVTYSKHDLTNELYISNAFDETLFIESEIETDYTLSNAENRLRLLSSKDEYAKFGTISDSLLLLSHHYRDQEYKSYDNSYKQIDKNKLYDFLGNHLRLSYTSMDTYYKCAFRYYLEYILRIDKFENNFQAVIGNIFHRVLSECFLKDRADASELWEKCVQECGYEFNNMETFFLNNLKGEVELVVDTIKNQLSYSSLKKSLYEQEIIIPIDKNMNVEFIGFIDKVIYDEFDGTTIAAVIDYKTGNPSLAIENAVYGLDMQLPIYIYLLKNSDIIKNVKIGGFYLQKILNNAIDADTRIESLKLQGFSNSDLDVLEKVDSSYEASHVIKSMRMTSNGFSSYAKVLSDEDMNMLEIIIDKKIKESAQDILNAKFDINPKELNGLNVGCKYCKFNSICYRQNRDIVKLKKVTKEEMLGGVHNA